MKNTVIFAGALALAMGALPAHYAKAEDETSGRKFELLWDAVGGLQSDLQAEIAARMAADAALQSALDAEETARIAADAALQSALNAETAARIAGDNALQAQITANDNDIQALWAHLADIAVSEAEATGAIDGFNSTSYTSILSDSVDAPSGGTLLIWANVNAEWDVHSSDYRDLEARIFVNGSAVSILQDQELEDPGAAGVNDGESIALTAAVTVAAGTHNVEIQALAGNGTGTIFIKDRSLHSLFLPSTVALAAAEASEAISEDDEPIDDTNE